METDGSDGTSNASSKRQRREITRQTRSYPRKRALKACDTCRMRKTKCNNEKPVCGFCQSLGATCAYSDAAYDASTLDPASQLIVERLDQVLQKLEQNASHSSRSFDHVQTPGQIQLDSTAYRTHIDPGISSQLPAASVTTPQINEDDLNMDENMMTPACRTSPDAVLDWPKFEKQYPWGYITDSLFTEEFNGARATTAIVEGRSGGPVTPASINEESVPRLVEAFLCRVHTKCPVLDVEVARNFARDVAQDGLRWNGESCLTLIMCALGCIARPFSDLYNQIAPLDGKVTSKRLHSASLCLGKVYYEAACKRIGLLEPSILATQCIFLCGVYEMYIMHPLRAWRWFSYSSSTLYTYLRCQEVHSRKDQSSSQSSDAQRLEASLYWSCYKSMCELRTELPLPASLLAEVKYPHVLPTPPPNLDGGMEVDNSASPLFEATPESFSQLQGMEVGSDKMQEQAWFFYLTDIILSRLGTRVLLNLYDDDHHSWDGAHIHRMVRAADEFENQLNDWFITLPEPIQFSNFDIRPNHELRFTVQFRALEIKSWLYRPFLYYAIHHVPYSSCSPRIQSLVLKAIETSIQWILLRPVRHRHHGSWYVGRLVLSSALCLLAAVKAGIKTDKLADWRDIITEAISAMDFWAEESEDFGRGREILETLFGKLNLH